MGNLYSAHHGCRNLVPRPVNLQTYHWPTEEYFKSAADDRVPNSVEEVVIQPTPDDDCQDSRADSFQSVSVQTLPFLSIPRGTRTGWYSVSRGVQVFPSGSKTVAKQPRQKIFQQ
ncbi:uncharacterized protein LOC143226930 [Tachypleus tridentatus]|uniref:uncharacterized protein LOC143226930 n=1 Tax=Tachypleus tridentatus TaxID=6853 RepID=UPI003FD03AB3